MVAVSAGCSAVSEDRECQSNIGLGVWTKISVSVPVQLHSGGRSGQRVGAVYADRMAPNGAAHHLIPGPMLPRRTGMFLIAAAARQIASGSSLDQRCPRCGSRSLTIKLVSSGTRYSGVSSVWTSTAIPPVQLAKPIGLRAGES